MIRFSCPHCNRPYVLANALAHLPLLCKGCSQRITPPDPEPDPPPTPVNQSGFQSVLPRRRPETPTATTPDSSASDPGVDTPVPSNPADPPLFEKPELIDERPVVVTPAEGALRAGQAPTPARSRKALPLLVDLVVLLIVLAVGALVGEMVAKKKTADILKGATSSPKFPPLDLLIWLGGPVIFGLLYAWLGTRGWTVGGWLKRRSAD